MAVDVALVVTSVIFAILVIIGALYFVVYFQHPQDKWAAWFPKLVVIVSFSLAAWNLFLLPLDVANQKGDAFNEALPMEKITLTLFGTTMVMVILVVPFTIFYYEGEDNLDDESDDSSGFVGQFGYALKFMIPTLILFAGAVAAMYWGGLGYAEIQTVVLQAPLFDTTNLEVNALDSIFTFDFYCDPTKIGVPFNTTSKVAGEEITYLPIAAGTSASPLFGCSDLRVGAAKIQPVCCAADGVNSIVASPIVFIVAVVTLLGWLFFSVFAGVGMVSLPYDWLNEFKYRPKPITKVEYDAKKREIGEASSRLMAEYNAIKEEFKAAGRSNNFSRRYRKVKNKENQFRKDVIILENNYRKLEDCYRFQGGNILLQWAKFAFAVLAVILTLAWLIHICVYVIPYTLQLKGLPVNPIDPFLNAMLNSTKEIPFIGIVIYGIFVFYLLFCVIKGNQKLGMRILFFTVHPLVVGESMMSALLFNSGVVLLCSMPIAHFATLSFNDYAQFTSSQSIFGVQVSSLKGINYGYDIFLYILLGFIVLTFCYSMFNPYKKHRENKLKF